MGKDIIARTLDKTDLAGIDTLIYRSPDLNNGTLISIDGENNIIPRTLDKTDLGGIDDLLYKTNIGTNIDGELLTTDGQNLIKKEISTTNLTVFLFFLRGRERMD
jgi:hypothetical protein